MWTWASLYAPVLFAAGSGAAAHSKRDGLTHPGNRPLAASLPIEAPQTPSPAIDTRPGTDAATWAISSLPLVAPPLSPVPPGSPARPIYTNTTRINSPPVIPTIITHASSASPTNVLDTTSISLNSSSTRNGFCTGCVLAAHGPVTTSFDPYELRNPWSSTVVTETIVTEFSTYLNNNTIETVVTEQRTVNQTKTLTGWDNQLITHTTPHFKVQVTDGVYVTLDAGPTYVIYTNLFGAPDDYVERYHPGSTRQLCIPTVTSLHNWQPAETATGDWSYFIATHTRGPLSSSTKADQPYPLPTKLINYLKQDSDIQSQFRGSHFASCSISLDPSLRPELPPSAPTAPARTTLGVPPPAMLPSTSTFLSTTYESTSVHVTVRGCLRCQLTDKNDLFDSTNTATPTYGGTEPTPRIPYATTNSDDDNNPGVTTGRSVTIGGTVLPVNNPRPTQSSADTPNDQNQDGQNELPPIIIIGSQTFKPGETKTVNGVAVVVPTNGGGTRLVVDGSTIAISPASTPGPVLTVGGGTVTANSQGEFVLGTETLTAGGPPITINGNTISLGPSSVAIINGVTQTIANTPDPTAGPALTVGGQTVSATDVGGSTVFVVAPGQTLGAGSSLVVDGTTYSMPEDASGSVIVINGVTSTVSFAAGITAAPALTINGITYPLSVRDGTTEYVLGEGTTLAPGSAVEVDGTTYSLDESGTALIINGQTSTLPQLPKSTSVSTTSSGSISTRSRNAGDLIASGIGESSRGVSPATYGTCVEKWLESVIVGAIGWLVILL